MQSVILIIWRININSPRFYLTQTNKTPFYLQHIEKQASEFSSFHHEERHFITQSGCCWSKTPVRYGLVVNGFNYLVQHLLRVGWVLCLLHEYGEVGVHIATVVPHAVQDFYQFVHFGFLRISHAQGNVILQHSKRVQPKLKSYCHCLPFIHLRFS